MSEGEIWMLVIHGFVAFFAWLWWYAPFVDIKQFGRPVPGAPLAILTPPFCLALTVYGLQTLAASDVVGTFYVIWYAIMTAAWVGAMAVTLMPILGLRFLDDAIERRNPAAMITSLTAIIALTLAFLGGNFGEGPGWWVVAICGVLAFGGFFALWLIVAIASNASQRVTIERDLATALRVGGLFLGSGLVIGRAVAGDWISMAGTWQDYFNIVWLLPILAGLEVGLCYVLPVARRAGLNLLWLGFLPGFIYLCICAAHVAEVGWW